MRVFLVLALLGLASCITNGSGPSRCIAGDQKSCACVGGQQGIQVCQTDGTYNTCHGCSSPDLGAHDMACTSPSCDPNNCGAVGYQCANGRACVASRCTPAWQPLTTSMALSGRNGHAAVGFGGKYVVFGGTLAAGGAGAAVDSGASYDPATDTWSSLPALTTARCQHAAVASGNRIYAFGGLTDCSNAATAGPGLEEFGGASWAPIATAGAPSARYNLPAVWTGTQLFVYGGSASGTQPAVATGGRFNPAGPAWTNADCPLLLCERGGDFGLFLDGNFVRVWGGGPYGSAPNGLAYNLALSSWSAWNVPANTPTLPKHYADDGRRIYFLNPTSSACPHSVEVLIYDRQTSSWLPKDTSSAPTGLLAQAAAAWVGNELIAWSGNCGAGNSMVGGRYQPPAPLQ